MRRTSTLSIALAGAICLTVISARAEPYEPQIVPPCKRYALADGREVCGYLTIEEVREVYRADAELVQCREASSAQLDQVRALRGEVEAVRAALAVEEESRQAAEAMAVQLSKDLVEENRKLENERAKPRWGSPVAWTTAAVLGAALLGFVGADLID